MYLRPKENILPNGTKDEVRVSGGKAELVKRVSDKTILNGSENWETWEIKETTCGFYVGRNTVKDIDYSGNNIILSDKLNSVTYAYIYSNDIPYLISGYNKHSETYALFIRLPKSIADTVAKCKQWLQENPVTLTYQLAEPLNYLSDWLY